MTEVKDKEAHMVGTERKMRVLLVEDDRYLAHACRDALELADFEVDSALDGHTALEKMKRIRPDFVLLDIILPIRNGFEVLEEMRMDEKLKDVPVLVFSNLSQRSDIEKGKALGAVDFLVKSDYSMKEIITKIKEYAAQSGN